VENLELQNAVLKYVIGLTLDDLREYVMFDLMNYYIDADAESLNEFLTYVNKEWH